MAKVQSNCNGLNIGGFRLVYKAMSSNTLLLKKEAGL